MTKATRSKSDLKWSAKCLIMDAIETKISFWRERNTLPDGVDPNAFEAELIRQAQRVASLFDYESDWTANR